MASGNIKGITIVFDGDTTKLGKALKDIDSKTRSLDKELRQVNNGLKFNPTNVELWRQKQQLLSEKVDETKKRLDALKLAQKEMDAQGVDKNSAQYRELQREIITTESKLGNFKKQLAEVGNANLKALSQGFAEAGSKIESAGQSLKGLSIAAAGVVASLGAISYKAGVAAGRFDCRLGERKNPYPPERPFDDCAQDRGGWLARGRLLGAFGREE